LTDDLYSWIVELLQVFFQKIKVKESRVKFCNNLTLFQYIVKWKTSFDKPIHDTKDEKTSNDLKPFFLQAENIDVPHEMGYNWILGLKFDVQNSQVVINICQEYQ